MKVLSLRASVTTIAVIDVLLGTILITVYVYLLADHIREIEVLHGSKSDEIILYVLASGLSLIRFLVAFQLFKSVTRTRPREPEDVKYIKWVPRCWIIVSLAFLIYCSARTLVFEQNRSEVSSLTLCYMEICFRVCGIWIVKLYIDNLGKIDKSVPSSTC